MGSLASALRMHPPSDWEKHNATAPSRGANDAGAENPPMHLLQAQAARVAVAWRARVTAGVWMRAGTAPSSTGTARSRDAPPTLGASNPNAAHRPPESG